MNITRHRPRWAIALAAAVTATALNVAPSQATPAEASGTNDPAAVAAASWISTTLVANDYVMPGFSGSGSDWGLTIDSLFALASAGVGKDVTDRVVQRIAGSGTAFTHNLGGKAKVALALQVGGADPTDFATPSGPIDLIADLRSSLQPNGQFAGANHFGQSLAVLALARTEEGVPSAASDYLLTLQCTEPDNINEGGFGFRAGPGNCASVDADGTGMVVSALAAAGYDDQDPAIREAIAWMVARQKADGSFAPQHSATTGNGNSTGLVGQAARQLETEDSVAVAERAAEFVEGLQVTCDSPFAEGAVDPNTGAGFIRDWRGALAYSQASYDGAVTGGIKSFQQDQWRRNTVQAILTLGDGPGFGELTTDDSSADIPEPAGCELAGTVPVVSGTPSYGSTLTAVAGSYSPAASGIEVAWRWLRGGRPIPGATSAAYTVSADDAGTELTVEATASVPSGGFTVAVDLSEPVAVAALPPKKLTVSATSRPVARGQWAAVNAWGLVPGERFHITLSGATIRTGVAGADGSVRTAIQVPATFGTDRARLLRVSGVNAKRVGERRLSTAAPAQLKVSAAKKRVTAKKTQKITVRGLLPGEAVTIKVAGRSARKGYASAGGTYSYSFKASTKTGTKRVSVTGVSGTRKGAASFRVVR